NAEDEEGDEVRDHEGTTAVLRRLNGEAQEVSEPDGIACHRQDQPHAAAPVFSYGRRFSCRGHADSLEAVTGLGVRKRAVLRRLRLLDQGVKRERGNRE